MRLQNVTKFVLSVQLLALLACQSKFNDKEPSSAGGSTGFTIESRIKANEDLDKKLARVEDVSEKIRRLIQSFRKIQALSSSGDAYTHIDFMLDINEEFANSPIEMHDDKWVKYGKIELKINGLSEECRVVQTKVETYNLSQLQNKPDSDGLVYSVKTCDTNGQYLSILNIKFSETNISLNFENKTIKKVLSDTLFPAIEVGTGCEIDTNIDTVLSQISCKNLSAKLTTSEKIIFKDLVFDVNGEDRVKIVGEIYENEKLKAKLNFTVDKSGKSKLEAERQ